MAVNANLDGKLVYLGLAVSPNPVEPGQTVTLTHYWRVQEPPGAGWRIFTHAQGPGGAPYLNVDHLPVRGKYPPSQWKAGQIVRDEHSFSLPPGWKPSTLEVYVGLWRGAERMPIRSGPHDAQSRVLAATIPVKPSRPPPPPKRYLVHKTPRPIKIDGVLDEAAWKVAAWTGPFADLKTGGPGQVKTDAKLLWDDRNLYVALVNADPDVWGQQDQDRPNLAEGDAVQLLLDAAGDGKSSLELLVSPRNIVVEPGRRPGAGSFRVKTAVKVDGTLDRREDRDRGWTVELALPLADVKGLAAAGVTVPPALGDAWRLNLVRLDAASGAPPGKDRVAVAWSPPLDSDVHTLQRFGQIAFVDARGYVPLSVPRDRSAAQAPVAPHY